jgi:hypothetical protein
MECYHVPTLSSLGYVEILGVDLARKRGVASTAELN